MACLESHILQGDHVLGGFPVRPVEVELVGSFADLSQSEGDVAFVAVEAAFLRLEELDSDFPFWIISTQLLDHR